MRRPAFLSRKAGRMPAAHALPAHVRFLLGHATIGILVGWLFAAALLALDVASLRTMMLRGGDGLLALGLLLFGTTITFGSAAMGAAIMGLGAPPPQPPSGRPRALAAVPVRARQVRRPS
jgi:hypothetical protein